MKRVLSICMALVLALACCVSVKGKAISFTPNFTIQSEAAALVSLDTEEIVYAKNVDTLYSPGSLVQIMVAVIVLENCSDLSTTVVVDSSLYAQFTGTNYPDDIRYADIENGDVLTVKELLYAMMLTSSCEASVVLADYIGGGSSESFVAMMNDKAEELGMTQTYYVNPTGMYSDAQRTTVNDTIALTRYALSVNRFEEIASTSNYTVTDSEGKEQFSWTHSNSMLLSSSDYYMEGVKGIKTANLTAQGRSIVCEASLDGTSYLVVCMAAPFEDSEGTLQYYHLDDATSLLEWGFSHFSYETILSSTTELGQVTINNGDGTDYVLVRPVSSYMTLWYDSADTASIVQEIALDENVSAPVEAGDILGTVTLKYSGETIAEIDLVATSSVELSTYKYYLALIKHFPETDWLYRAILISALLCAIYIALCIHSYAVYRQKLKPVQPTHLKPKASAVKREAEKERAKEERLRIKGKK